MKLLHGVSLRTQKKYPPSLDLLGLFAALYREACLSYNPNYAKILGLEFDNILDLLTWEAWLIDYKDFFGELVQQRIIYGKADYWPNDKKMKPISEKSTTNLIVDLNKQYPEYLD